MHGGIFLADFLSQRTLVFFAELNLKVAIAEAESSGRKYEKNSAIVQFLQEKQSLKRTRNFLACQRSVAYDVTSPRGYRSVWKEFPSNEVNGPQQVR